MSHAIGEGAGEVQGAEVLEGCQGLPSFGLDVLQVGRPAITPGQ